MIKVNFYIFKLFLASSDKIVVPIYIYKFRLPQSNSKGKRFFKYTFKFYYRVITVVCSWYNLLFFLKCIFIILKLISSYVKLWLENQVLFIFNLYLNALYIRTHKKQSEIMNFKSFFNINACNFRIFKLLHLCLILFKGIVDFDDFYGGIIS